MVDALTLSPQGAGRSPHADGSLKDADPLRAESPAAALTLRVSEVFLSLQGETSRAGLPTVFVRLTGCPLRCRWCDTTYSFQGGETVTLNSLLARIAEFGVPTVCVTGGEPLAQKNCPALLSGLCDAGYSVSLETSGALDVSGVDPRVSRIVDIKAPGSGEEARNRWDNLAHLTPHDEIKFVLASRADYDWACEVLHAQKLAQICPVLFSPVQGELPPAELADWVIADRLPVRMQVQLHKILWGNTPGK
ncbi:7-carboxy-7-deazaguanine synthase QueE [Thiobacillus sp.]|uniref:7-carboxy-7-deazaguanine synthase QueE n=1 Tax=Thiobacillus sp. TaxID=924 RepID=UPI0025D4E89C|nr:7-carboxy-7-deazaguanine synthase QueE [Thiobacillus sp.]MBT9540761.1 7-carboxy-7-deazaguanine synthase QueE [Thiobacillus sp.]